MPPTPAEYGRQQIATIAETGTTASVDFLGRPIILLTARGVRSGERRQVPLMRVERDGVYAIVASMGGGPRNPAWYANVKAEPHVELQDGAVTKAYTAREVTGGEKAAWWARAVDAFPPYAELQKKTDREMPVFLLEERPA